MKRKTSRALKITWLVTMLIGIVVLVVYVVKLTKIDKQQSLNNSAVSSDDKNADTGIKYADSAADKNTVSGLDGLNLGGKGDQNAASSPEQMANSSGDEATYDITGAGASGDKASEGAAGSADASGTDKSTDTTGKTDGAQTAGADGSADKADTADKSEAASGDKSDEDGSAGKADADKSDSDSNKESGDSDKSDSNKSDSGDKSYATDKYHGVDPSKPMVALSYDDGPSIYTDEIIEVLEAYGAHATFFTLGECSQNYPDQLRHIYESGNEVGNHTINHKNLKKESKESIIHQLEGNQDIINEILGTNLLCIIRPPYGNYNDTVKSVAKAPLVNWSVDTLDWSSKNAEKVFAEVKKQVDDGAIILCHDIYKSTLEATKLFVPWLIEQGYQICTVTDMYSARGEFQHAGVVYSHTMSAKKYLENQEKQEQTE